MRNIKKIVERTFQVDPNVVCVEDLELANYMVVSLMIGGLIEAIVHTRLEVLNVFRRNLGNLKQPYLAIVVNESTTLSAATLLIKSSLEQKVILP